VRSLIYQFFAPVAIVAIGGALEALTGYWAFTLLGFVAGVVLAAVFAQRALARLAQLQLIASRQFAPGRAGQVVSWPRDNGDEIDEALHHAEAFVSSASARWAEESERVRHLSNVLDRMRDAVIQVDAHGVVTYGNLAAAKIFGGRNPAGRSFIRVVRDHQLDDLVRHALETGEDGQRTIALLGDSRVMNAIVVRINQFPREALVVLRDITELHRLQDIRREFVASVSHELQPPLGAIKVMAGTILDLQPDNAEVRQVIAAIDEEIDSMTAMVDDLLDISQLEKGSESLRYETVDPAELVDVAISQLRPRAGQAGINLTVAPADALAPIRADGKRLQHALTNLVTNAIDHTPEGGRIEVGVTQAAAETTFTVADDGEGIAEADIDRIWERFFKSDRSRSEPGTGLGLAIVKHVALAHGGKIAVESKPGSGATFRISVPDGTRDAAPRVRQ